jgi:ABC-2 type transport system permease protein
MSAFSRALAAEIEHLGRDRWDLGLLILQPAILIFLMAAMLFQGVARELPVAVVDEDQSTLSRAIIRDVDASPTVRVVPARDLPSAFSEVRGERVMAVLYIPQGLVQGFVRPPAAAVQIFYQAIFFSTGTTVSKAMNTSVTASLKDHAPNLLSSHGLPAERKLEPRVQITILGNPAGSLEWFLSGLIQPCVLQLYVACMTVVALGRELKQGTLAEWARQSGGVAGALAGKFLPYVAVTSVFGVLWLVWLVLFRGGRVEGSLAMIAAGQVILFAGTAAISGLMVASIRKIFDPLVFSVLYAGTAIAYSNASLSLNEGSAVARFWSQAIPYRHYIDLQMGQFLGTPFSEAFQPLAALGLYIVVAGAGAVLLLRKAGR